MVLGAYSAQCTCTRAVDTRKLLLYSVPMRANIILAGILLQYKTIEYII